MVGYGCCSDAFHILYSTYVQEEASSSYVIAALGFADKCSNHSLSLVSLHLVDCWIQTKINNHLL